MNNLVLSQLEASRTLQGDPLLEKVTFINEIKWPKKSARFVTAEVNDAYDELRVANAKIMIRQTFKSLGSPVSLFYFLLL
jgi:hypothetical protein